MRKIASFGDPRLYALTQAARRFSRSKQPLVPASLFVTAGNGVADTSTGMVGTLFEPARR